MVRRRAMTATVVKAPVPGAQFVTRRRNRRRLRAIAPAASILHEGVTRAIEIRLLCIQERMNATREEAQNAFDAQKANPHLNLFFEIVATRVEGHGCNCETLADRRTIGNRRRRKSSRVRARISPKWALFQRSP